MSSLPKSLDDYDVISVSENEALSVNSHSLSARSISVEGRQAQSHTAQSLFSNSASFVDLRLTRPPDSLKPKPGKGTKLFSYFV